MSRSDRMCLSTLERAHRLGFLERRLCRKLTALYGLEGQEGPDTSPSVIFFRPSFWDVFLRDARSGCLPGFNLATIQSLKSKLFPELEAL